MGEQQEQDSYGACDVLAPQDPVSEHKKTAKKSKK